MNASTASLRESHSTRWDIKGDSPWLVSVEISSYMSDPKDAMNLKVTFSRLPDGTNHVNSVVMDGVSKQLNIATQNSNYQHV